MVERDPIVQQVIGAAIEVHRVLGPGMLESTCEGCLVYELVERGLRVEQQVSIPLVYKNARIPCGYRIDLLVEGDVIVEVKSVERVSPVHHAQVLTYLRLMGARRALLFNFNELTLKRGLWSYLGRGNNGSRASQ